MSYRQQADELKSIFHEFKDVHLSLKNEIKKLGEETQETRNQLEKVQDALDEVETKLSRPKLMGADNKAETDKYTEAWKKWYCQGDDRELKTITMNETVDPQGGYLVPPEFANVILDSLVQWSPIRRYARVMRVNSKEFRIPVQQQAQNLQTGAPAAGLFRTGWTADQGPITNTDAGQVSMKIIPTCDLYAEPLVSQDLLDDAMVNMDNYIRTNLSKSFAFAEGSAFVNGDGVGKPTGLVTTAQDPAGGMSSVTASTGVQYSIGTSPDLLINAYYTLPDFYARRGTWLMNRQTIRIVRTWVDGNGQYLWTPNFGTSTAYEAPALILDRPYAECIDMAAPSNITTGAYTAGAVPILFGDVESAYLITDRIAAMTMLRDPYSQKPFIQFYCTSRVGGLTVLPEAMVAVNVNPS